MTAVSDDHTTSREGAAREPAGGDQRLDALVGRLFEATLGALIDVGWNDWATLSCVPSHAASVAVQSQAIRRMSSPNVMSQRDEKGAPCDRCCQTARLLSTSRFSRLGADRKLLPQREKGRPRKTREAGAALGLSNDC